MSELLQHFEPTHGRYWYCRVPETEVPTEKRRVAAKILEFVVGDLGLADVALKVGWFRRESWQVAYEEARQHLPIFLTTPGNPRCDCFSDPSDLDGLLDRESEDEILIRSALEELYLKKAVAHELRHVWQKRTWADPSLIGGVESETDAYAYCEDAVARFEASRPQ